MTSKELVQLTLRGKPTPRVPTGPLAVHFCAHVAGKSVRAYSNSARELADSVIRYYERFRPDAIWLSADTWVSAEAMGARVGAMDDQQPFGGIGPSLIQSPADLERIPSPDVGALGRYPLMLEALSRIVGALGEEVFIVACFDQYPFSLAAALMGIQEIMLKLADDPPFVEAVMERALEYATAYASALNAAGADMLSGGDSPAGLIGPALHRRVVLPFEQRMIRALKQRITTPISLHICGNATPYLPAITASGADVLELDHHVNLGEACQNAGPGITIWGNLDPVGLLARATPKEVTLAAQKAMSAAHDNNHARFVLSSGCTLTLETPFENLDALIKATL